MWHRLSHKERCDLPAHVAASVPDSASRGASLSKSQSTAASKSSECKTGTSFPTEGARFHRTCTPFGGDVLPAPLRPCTSSSPALAVDTVELCRPPQGG